MHWYNGGMSMPELQYALFCREVIEDTDQLTFKGVINEIFLEQPEDISINFVLGLQNIPHGSHKVIVNHVSPSGLPTNEISSTTYRAAVDTDKSLRNSLFTWECNFRVEISSTHVFTVIFNDNPLIRLGLSVYLGSEQV